MTALLTLPSRASQSGLRKFSVDEYERLISLGIITDDEKIELLDGYLVNKMAHNPPHAATVQNVSDVLKQYLPVGWAVRNQLPIRLSLSEPEPDVVVVKGRTLDYKQRHPTVSDIGLTIEVSDSTLLSDRDDKLPIYAADGLGQFWIVNLVNQQIEVYTNPVKNRYQTTQILKLTDTIAFTLPGETEVKIPVIELIG